MLRSCLAFVPSPSLSTWLSHLQNNLSTGLPRYTNIVWNHSRLHGPFEAPRSLVEAPRFASSTDCLRCVRGQCRLHSAIFVPHHETHVHAHVPSLDLLVVVAPCLRRRNLELLTSSSHSAASLTSTRLGAIIEVPILEFGFDRASDQYSEKSLSLLSKDMISFYRQQRPLARVCAFSYQLWWTLGVRLLGETKH